MTENTILVPGLHIGAPARYANLAVFPLTGLNGTERDYIVLDEALASKTAVVTEVSAGGSVPELRFRNNGGEAVFLLDGEELVGAKQNRVLNLSILVPARAEIKIPVSCVEQGRWSHRSDAFTTSGQAQYAKARAMKLRQVSNYMASTGTRHSDQGEIWHDIAEKAMRMNSVSDTGAMSDIYEQNRVRLRDYQNAFTTSDGQVGAVFAIDDQVVGMDLFDHPVTLRTLFPKIITSYALDALETAGREDRGPDSSAAERLLAAVSEAPARRFPSIGEGEDVRIEGPAVAGAALVARGRTIHLSAFRVDGGGEGRGEVTGRISPSSARRHNLFRRRELD